MPNAFPFLSPWLLVGWSMADRYCFPPFTGNLQMRYAELLFVDGNPLITATSGTPLSKFEPNYDSQTHLSFSRWVVNKKIIIIVFIMKKALLKLLKKIYSLLDSVSLTTDQLVFHRKFHLVLFIQWALFKFYFHKKFHNKTEWTSKFYLVPQGHLRLRINIILIWITYDIWSSQTLNLSHSRSQKAINCFLRCTYRVTEWHGPKQSDLEMSSWTNATDCWTVWSLQRKGIHPIEKLKLTDCQSDYEKSKYFFTK